MSHGLSLSLRCCHLAGSCRLLLSIEVQEAGLRLALREAQQQSGRRDVWPRLSS